MGGDAAQPPDQGLEGAGDRVLVAGGDGAPGDAPQGGVAACRVQGLEQGEGVGERGGNVRFGRVGVLGESEQREDAGQLSGVGQFAELRREGEPVVSPGGQFQGEHGGSGGLQGFAYGDHELSLIH